MALTQSARLPGPGPSWDEEVVPVLRQRLENESRTLARRISAISASSNEDVNEYRNHNHNTTTNSNNSRSNSSGKSSTNYGSASAPRPSSSRSRTYSQPYQYHVETNPTSSARSKYVNGHVPSSNAPSTPSSAAAAAAARSISPRPSTSTDSHNYSTPPKPSRIPQPTTRTRASSITASGHTQFPPPGSTLGSPYSGGGGGGASSGYVGSPHTPTQDSSRSADLWIVHEQQQSSPPPTLPPHSRHHHHPNSTNFPPSSSSSSSLTNSAVAVVAAAHRVPGLLHEPAPFSPPGSQSSSTLNHSSQENGINGSTRPSIDSQEEERPFEHWYRGEVSRNGGVGELRVGKRQEMLEIASYGYDLSESPSPSGRMRTGGGGGGGRERNAITEAIEEERERRRRVEMMRRQQQQQQQDQRGMGGRRRADSVGSLDDRETEERRASFYMDPEKARQAERVMDEGPLTDLEGDDYEYRNDGEDGDDLDMDEDGYRYYDAEEDYHEGERTKTPTSYAYNTSSSGTKSEPSLLGTPNNASNNAHAGAGGSSATKGRMTPTSGPGRGGTKSPTANSKSPSTPTQRPGGARQRQISASSRTPNSTTTTPGGGAAAAKRAASSSPSPSTPSKSPSSNSRLAASKATQAKLAAAKKQKMLEGDSRRSVGQYDLSKLSSGEEGLDGVDADAIPKWTVPVTKAGSGGWDDVILPVVARNQGLNGHFETADGSPRQVKDSMEGEIVPAPGTFGYDHSKYRPPRDFSDPDAIPMDEFGVGKDRGRLLLRGVQEEEQNRIGEGEVSAHDQTRLPIRNQQPLATTTATATRMGVPQSSASASPVPFADYAPRRGGPVGLGIVDATGQQQQMVDLEAQRTEKEQQQQIEEEESGGGGCCKCIVM